ncbi:type II toxin-antitoxin system prevent-host-death family antitoxin [Baekduia sp.]|jgi:prevent-host-death family protein|uniref:type II toxin-antitoxin system Phd/YefM family antitoxin n=1 Tax=Baekduia sp. TaxID=2600305 RepID=UPI002E08D53C|nr:type II toxin-antitoxin system prevent-host-death family antitoxin [Baekduia sp.]
MERIGVRELRQHATRYLSRVKAGETVEVTERGRLVALLVPPDPASSARERLIASGQLVPAAHSFRLPQRTPATSASPDSGTVLDDLRADRA